MRRILCFCTLLLTVVLARPSFSQTQNDGWQLVRNLPAGKTIDLYTGTKHQRCKFLLADDEQISCQRGKRDTFTFSHTEIRFGVAGAIGGTATGFIVDKHRQKTLYLAP